MKRWSCPITYTDEKRWELGGYEIIERIGKGGTGEVYRARDDKLGRDVAIKVLPEELSQDQERRDRFEREARLLAHMGPHLRFPA